jgi:hypothetical protein
VFVLLLREQAQPQMNSGGMQMGSTEFQHDTKSSVLRNTTKDVPDCALESSGIVEEYRKK